MISISSVYTPKKIWKHFSHIIRYGKRFSTSKNYVIRLINNCKILDTQYNIDYDYLIHYFVYPCIKIYSGK